MNVLIVESLHDTRASLQSALSDIPEVKVVGRAVSEAVAIERISALLPDVVILCLGLQSGVGIGVLEKIKKLHAAIKVIVFTRCADTSCIDRCKDAGADQFFDKSSQFMQLHEALSTLAHADKKALPSVRYAQAQ